MDTENCTINKCTHTHTHIQMRTHAKTTKIRFCLVCKFQIEIRAFKHNTDLITICQLDDEYIKHTELTVEDA